MVIVGLARVTRIHIPLLVGNSVLKQSLNSKKSIILLIDFTINYDLKKVTLTRSTQSTISPLAINMVAIFIRPSGAPEFVMIIFSALVMPKPIVSEWEDALPARDGAGYCEAIS